MGHEQCKRRWSKKKKGKMQKREHQNVIQTELISKEGENNKFLPTPETDYHSLLSIHISFINIQLETLKRAAKRL